MIMPSINNNGGLVDGRIPAGQACPFLDICTMRSSTCPTTQATKTVNFSCAAARAHSMLLVSDSAILRKIFQKEKS